MTPIYSISHKNTSFKLSDQVKETLHKKGYSSIFNYSDYFLFKSQAKNAFNKVQAIAELFIQDNTNSKSDYNGYIF